MIIYLLKHKRFTNSSSRMAYKMIFQMAGA